MNPPVRQLSHNQFRQITRPSEKTDEAASPNTDNKKSAKIEDENKGVVKGLPLKPSVTNGNCLWHTAGQTLQQIGMAGFTSNLKADILIRKVRATIHEHMKKHMN